MLLQGMEKHGKIISRCRKYICNFALIVMHNSGSKAA